MSFNKLFSGDILNASGGTSLAFRAFSAKSILANATNASAVPVELAGSAAFQHLRVNSGNTGLEWSILTTGDFPTNSVPITAHATQATDTFIGNITAGTATPIAVGLTTISSTSLIWDATTHTFQRAALTGAVTSAQNSNATAFGVLAAKSVLANSTNASAVPAALAGSAAFQHLRVNSGNTALEWSVLTSGDFPAGTVPLTGMATQAAETFLGNFTAGVASPTALAGATVAGGGLTYTTGGILAVGAGTNVTVNANDIAVTNFPLSGLATQAADTMLGNFTAGTAVPTARAGTSIAGAGLTYTTGGTIDVGGSTSIIAGASDIQRAALTGEVTSAQNSNAMAIARNTNFAWTGEHDFNNVLATISIFSNLAVAANLNDLAIGAVNTVRLATTGITGPYILTGMVPTSNGQLVWLENSDTTDSLIIGHENTGSVTAGNRFTLSNNTNLLLPPATGVWCRYDSTTARWYVNNVQLPPNASPYTTATETAAGPFNDYAIPNLSTTRFTLNVAPAAAGTVSFSGFLAAGGNVDGYRFAVNFTTSTTAEILFVQQATSVATNQIANPGSIDLHLTDRGMIEFEYRSSRWRVISSGANRVQTFTTAGLTSNLALLTDTVTLRVDTGNSDWSIDGLLGGFPGRRITLQNASNIASRGTLVSSTNSVSTATNQIITPDNIDRGGHTRYSAVLEYDGTDSAWRLVSDNVIPEKRSEYHEFQDDFHYTNLGDIPALVSGSGTDLRTGQGSWGVGSQPGNVVGGILNIAPELNHPGILRLTTGTTSGTSVFLYKGTKAPLANFTRGDEIGELEVCVRQTGGVGNLVAFWIGFTTDVTNYTSLTTPASFIGFYFDTAGDLTDTTIHCVTRESSGTATNIDSNVAPSGTFQLFTIRQSNSGTITFYINNVLVATTSTATPDAETMNLALAISTRSAAERILDIDYVSYKSRPIDRTV